MYDAEIPLSFCSPAADVSSSWSLSPYAIVKFSFTAYDIPKPSDSSFLAAVLPSASLSWYPKVKPPIAYLMKKVSLSIDFYWLELPRINWI